MVAGEVKTLANQTAKATEEIGTQVAQIQAMTQQAVEVSTAARTITAGTSGLAGMAARSNEAALQVKAATASMVEQTESLRGEVARFLEDLRAA